jgi:hypothetical protein
MNRDPQKGKVSDDQSQPFLMKQKNPEYKVSHDGMSVFRSERSRDKLNGPLLISFHVLSICCNAAMHRVNLLI